jgi:hypothetical protein
MNQVYTGLDLQRFHWSWCENICFINIPLREISYFNFNFNLHLIWWPIVAQLPAENIHVYIKTKRNCTEMREESDNQPRLFTSIRTEWRVEKDEHVSPYFCIIIWQPQSRGHPSFTTWGHSGQVCGLNFVKSCQYTNLTL